MRAAISIIRWVEVKKEAKERLAKCASERLCTACMEPLGDGKAIRGMHPKCEQATMRAIQQGKTTEKERVSEGKMLERAKPGRKPTNAVTCDVA